MLPGILVLVGAWRAKPKTGNIAHLASWACRGKPLHGQHTEGGGTWIGRPGYPRNEPAGRLRLKAASDLRSMAPTRFNLGL